MSTMLITTAVAYVLFGQAVAQGSLQLKARVGTACYASVLSDEVIHVEGKLVYRALISERCNQAGGYQVILHHRGGLRGASVQTGVNHIDIANTSSETVIAQSDVAGIGDRDLTVTYGASEGEIDFAVELRPRNATH